LAVLKFGVCACRPEKKTCQKLETKRKHCIKNINLPLFKILNNILEIKDNTLELDFVLQIMEN